MALTLEDLKVLLKEQKEEILQNINEATKRVIKNTDEKVGIISEKVDKLEKIVETQGTIIQKQEDICLKQEKRISQLEVGLRKNNVIVFKVEETETNEEELKDFVIKIINKSNEDFQLTTNDIESCFRLGKSSNGKNRPIRLTFKSFDKKQKILLTKKSLTKYSIAEDLPKSLLEVRKPLIPKLQEFKKQGKRAFFKLDQLVVEGKVWNENEEYDPENPRKRTRSIESSPPQQTKGNDSNKKRQ